MLDTMIVAFPMALAVVAVLVVERATRAYSIRRLRISHRREVRKTADEKYHEGYRKAALFYSKPKPMGLGLRALIPEKYQ